MDIKHWMCGLTLSIVVGGIVTAIFLCSLRRIMGLGEKPKLKHKDIKRVSPWLTGAIERLFFTVLIAEGIAGAAPAMIGWLALKLATNWNRDDWNKNPRARSFGFTALLGGLVSMLFAALGGLVCSGKLWPGILD